MSLITAGFAATHFRALEQTQRTMANEKSNLATRNLKLANDREKERNVAVAARATVDRQRDTARLAEQAKVKIAAQAEKDRDIAEREAYRSTIRLAESILRGDEQARYRVADLLWETQPELRGWEWGYTMARCPLEEWSLHTDQGNLDTMTASPDGHYLATAGSNGTVALWDTRTQREIWRQETGRVQQLSIDHQGRFIAVGSAEESQSCFTVLNPENGHPVTRGAGTGPAQVVFSASGDDLYVQKNSHLYRYDTLDWQPLVNVPLKIPHTETTSLFVDASGAAVGVQLNFVPTQKLSKFPRRFLFFDAKTLQLKPGMDSLNIESSSFYIHTAPILNTGRGMLIYTSGFDSVWQSSITASDVPPEPVAKGLPGRIENLCHDAQTDSIVAASDDGSVLVIDAEREIREFSHGSSIRGVANLDEGLFVTGGTDGLIKCWTLRDSAPPPVNLPMTETTATGATVEFIDNGQRLFFKTWESSAFWLIDTNSLQRDRVTTVPQKITNAIRPLTNKLIVRSKDGLSFYSLESISEGGTANRSLPFTRWTRPVFDASGRVMAVNPNKQEVAVFDLEANQPFPTPQLSKLLSDQFWLAISPSGTRGALYSAARLQIWEISSGRLLDQFDIHAAKESLPTPGNFHPAFHPDNTLIAIIEPESGIVVRNTDEHRQQQVIPTISGVEFWRCLFSPGGKRLLVHCSDSRTRIFDWRIGRELIALSDTTLDRQHCPLAISPDGRTIAYGGHNPSLRIAKALPWNSEAGPDANFYRAVDELRIYSSQIEED